MLTDCKISWENSTYLTYFCTVFLPIHTKVIHRTISSLLFQVLPWNPFSIKFEIINVKSISMRCIPSGSICEHQKYMCAKCRQLRGTCTSFSITGLVYLDIIYRTYPLDRRPLYNFCHYATMQKLTSTEYPKFTKIDGKRFGKMWTTGRKQKRLKNRIDYERMTLLRLSLDLIFV